MDPEDGGYLKASGKNRPGGAPKGKGYFGEIKSKDGRFVSTELTIGVDFGEGEENIPLLVPTLKKSQIDHLMAGKKPTDEMFDAAIDFALARKKAGLSPYADPEEEGTYSVPKE